MRDFINSLLICTVALLFAVSASSQTKPQVSIQWHKDYTVALKTAQKAGKPILINFNAVWCLQCRTMSEDVWSDPEIVKLTDEFVTVTLDFDRDRETVKRFGVNSVPHVVLADPWGNMLTFHHGFDKETSENAIRTQLKTAHKDFSEIKSPNYRLETDKNDTTALIEIGEFYRKINLLFLSNKYYKAALKTNQIKADASLREKVLIAAGDNYLKLRDYDEAERFFNDTLLEFPNGRYHQSALLGLLTINIRRQRFAEAETVFDRMKSKYPDSEITRKAAENLQEAKTQLN